jgi:CheY-like chemotaxis protein
MKKLNNILIVDDDPTSIFLISMILEGLGIADTIEKVYNGKQALEYLEAKFVPILSTSEEYESFLILLDLNMPVMNGFEFLEEFGRRFADYIHQITICILSSSSAGKDKLKALDYPISGYITKPLTEEKLKPILEKI